MIHELASSSDGLKGPPDRETGENVDIRMMRQGKQ